MLGFNERKAIKFDWDDNSFTFSITNMDNVIAAKTVEVSNTKMNHFTFRLNNNKLAFFLNGVKTREFDTDLDILGDMFFGFQELGIISFYNRKISRIEVGEYFADYHVKNFSKMLHS